jgi:hypothetical protein
MHYDNYRKALSSTLNHQLLLRDKLNPETMSKVQKIYTVLAQTETTPTTFLNFEKKIILLQSLPELLLKGGFAETIH